LRDILVCFRTYIFEPNDDNFKQTDDVVGGGSEKRNEELNNMVVIVGNTLQ